MPRKVGWQRALSLYILDAQMAYKRIGYRPGRFDCCIFAGNWVKELTGEDPLRGYRGQYKNIEEAWALVEQKDGSLLQALTHRFGEPIHPAKAQRGDIAFREADGMCGIFFTSGAHMMGLFLGDGGFSMYTVREISHAFHIE